MNTTENQRPITLQDLQISVTVIQGSIDALEVRLNKRIDDAINALEIRLNKRMDDVIKALELRINKRFEELEARVNKRFEELEARVNKRIEDSIDELCVMISNSFNGFRSALQTA